MSLDLSPVKFPIPMAIAEPGPGAQKRNYKAFQNDWNKLPFRLDPEAPSAFVLTMSELKQYKTRTK